MSINADISNPMHLLLAAKVSESPRLDGLTMVTRRFQANRDLRLTTFGRTVDLARGERVLLNFRYLFSKEAFRWLLTGHAGLRIAAEIPSADGRYLTCVCLKG